MPTPSPDTIAAFVEGGKATRFGAPLGNAGNARRRADMARRVRERTRDGEELVDFFLELMRGTLGADDPWSDGKAPSLSDRVDAAKWLWEHGYGKASNVDPLDAGASAEGSKIQVFVVSADGKRERVLPPSQATVDAVGTGAVALEEALG